MGSMHKDSSAIDMMLEIDDEKGHRNETGRFVDDEASPLSSTSELTATTTTHRFRMAHEGKRELNTTISSCLLNG
jgi:hypothetical protein